MKKTTLSMMAALPLLLAACAGGPDGGSEPSVEQLIANADAQVAAAKKSGYMWNSTEKHLENAKKAKKDLDTTMAIKEAKTAITESQLALDQAKAAETAQPHFGS